MFPSKFPDSPTTIFTIMSSLAEEHQAINLGQGFPDFPMSEELIELVSKAMHDGFNQYAHMNGLLSLRESISEKVNTLYKINVDPEECITITPGATYSLFTSLAAIIRPGDEVIIFEPAYDSYIPAVKMNGGIPVAIPLEHPDYKIDWDVVRSKINPRTRAVVINTPNNPTGNILESRDLMQLAELIKHTNFFVISDEVYEHLIFDGNQHQSVLRYPELFERSFVSFSFGKVYHCTGWKMGYCIAPAKLMKEFRKVHQYNAFSSDSTKQVALAQFIKNPATYQHLGEEIQALRDYLKKRLATTSLMAIPSKGTYFQLYSYKDLSNESEMEFCIRMTKEARVTAIPVSAFYSQAVNNHVIRLCFCKKKETLEEAAERIIHFL